MKIIFFLILVTVISVCYAENLTYEFKNIEKDYKNFYLEPNNLIAIGAGIGISGIFANTSVDRDIQDYYRERVKGRSTDNLADLFNLTGDYRMSVPLLIGTRFLFKYTLVADWSERSLRAIIVGTPAALFIQKVTGASRPEEGGSGWKPFKDSNGLSGHAFIGAVPFITAAKMNENVYIKGVLYGISFLPALSRINNNNHYFSQVILGWYVGFLSCNTVEKTDFENKTTLMLSPLPKGGMMILINHSF